MLDSNNYTIQVFQHHPDMQEFIIHSRCQEKALLTQIEVKNGFVSKLYKCQKCARILSKYEGV